MLRCRCWRPTGSSEPSPIHTPARSLRAAKAVSGDTDSRMFTHNAARRVTPAIVMRLSTEVSAGVDVA